MSRCRSCYCCHCRWRWRWHWLSGVWYVQNTSPQYYHPQHLIQVREGIQLLAFCLPFSLSPPLFLSPFLFFSFLFLTQVVSYAFSNPNLLINSSRFTTSRTITITITTTTNLTSIRNALIMQHEICCEAGWGV